MMTTSTMMQLIQQKLEAFERLQLEFEACFQFVQDVHGQKRLQAFPVAETVRYLHARWICETKGLLLSVPHTVKGYEGRRCLELLRHWQEDGDTAGVVAFLHEKLDMLPLANITRQVQELRREHGSSILAQRLEHGRNVLLNRGFHLMLALEAIFTMPESDLLATVRAACEAYEHRPEQIRLQLEEMNSPLYSYVPHSLLAQRNMTVMNKLGVGVTAQGSDRPGQRSWRVVEPTEPLSPYAEQVLVGYIEMTSPDFNNLRDHRFVDRPENSRSMEV